MTLVKWNKYLCLWIHENIFFVMYICYAAKIGYDDYLNLNDPVQ
jgi:hypothetical protein